MLCIRRRKILLFLQRRSGHVAGQGEPFSCPWSWGCVVHGGAQQAGLAAAWGGGWLCCWGQAGAGTLCTKILGMRPEQNTPLLLTQPLAEIS